MASATAQGVEHEIGYVVFLPRHASAAPATDSWEDRFKTGLHVRLYCPSTRRRQLTPALVNEASNECG